MYTKNKMANGWLELSAMPSKLLFRYLSCISGSFKRATNEEYHFFIAILATSMFCFSGLTAHAQSAEEEAVKKVIRTETEAWGKRDADAWQASWSQDPRASRTILMNNMLIDAMGWENFGPGMIKDIHENPEPKIKNFSNHNYNIRISGDIAWVNYDQKVISLDATPGPYTVSREQRVLVKEDGQWKILSQTTYLPETFGSSQEAVQNSLNTISYNFYEDKKLNEAIEVLKLTTMLYPQSWNTYNYLGVAYTEAGNKKMAIKSYERSLKLNPGNEEATKGLAELKQKARVSIK